MIASPFRFDVGALLKASEGTRESRSFAVSDIAWKEELGLVGALSGTMHVDRIDKALYVTVEELAFEHAAHCARCLTPIGQHVSVVQVGRLFPFEEETDPRLVLPEESAQGLDIGNAVLDLEPMIREESLLAIPEAPLCTDACLGLCDRCGKNRNTTPCDCVQEDHDLKPLASLRDQWNNLQP